MGMKGMKKNEENTGNPDFSAQLEQTANDYIFKKCLECGFDVEWREGFSVHLAACAELPTRFGTFVIAAFSEESNQKEHTAIVHGSVVGEQDCPLRVHSQCHTGDVFNSLRCDCRSQLEAALEYIASRPCGVVIYLKQEGRGIGLINKIRAYHLQDMGFDTVDANTCLGFPEDARDYRVASEIIQLLRIRSIALLTNNPRKIKGLKKEGITVTRRIPVLVGETSFNKKYIQTKRDRMGHLE